uniref:Uncharacterized protein n=1 Tax=Francisella tularensis subsp. novicida PA10-7858 TaxID=1386968 RepID=V5T9N7_FRANO|nr:hypothetical protein [Francisella tularensis]AHB60786.1 hypothetical protein N894_0018 [Francisella tularensis subsp. novicida PA10-7858]
MKITKLENGKSEVIGRTQEIESLINQFSELTSKGDFADRIVSIEDTPELVINVEESTMIKEMLWRC